MIWENSDAARIVWPSDYHHFSVAASLAHWTFGLFGKDNITAH
jgi:hypothetical protein